MARTKKKSAEGRKAHAINSQLEGLAVDIDSLKPDPENARLHDESNLASIRHSLSTYGQQKPIVVNRAMVVIAGNGTLMAAKALGWTEIAAVVYDGDGVEGAFALADNRSAELGRWDFRQLTDRLVSLREVGIDIERIGWKDYELAPLMDADWRPPQHNEKALDPRGDRPMTIKFTPEQSPVIDRAMKLMRSRHADKPHDARCLELICTEFLAGAP